MDDGSIWRCLTSVTPSAIPLRTLKITFLSALNVNAIIIYAVLFVLLILGGAYFASAEIAFASVNRVRMRSYAENGDRRAKYVMYVLNNFDKALSTLLIGNNVMHIGCSTIAALLTRQLFAGTNYLALALTISTIIVTMIVFLISEMLPKSYAKACNERYTMRVASSLYVLMKILTPLSAVFTWFGRLFSKVFSRGGKSPSVTENELVDIIETFRDDREEDEEQEDSTAELMVNALEFSGRTVAQCYTKWDAVETLDATLTTAEQYAQLKKTRYSRLPVINGKGRVIGVVLIRSFFREYIKCGDSMDLVNLLDTPYFVRPDVPVDQLLIDLSKSKTHIAFVSERSDILGIITVEDILEELVGEIYDEYDSVDAGVNAV